MQIKKEEVKNKIIQSAKEEFLNKGFEKSSIRTIVKKAETNIGNFYNYFNSKEQLFEVLVDDFYNQFKYLMENHHSGEISAEVLISKDLNVWREFLSELINPLTLMLNDRLLLLLEYSKDTKYENAKNELSELLSQHFIEHIREFSPNYKHEIMGQIISHQIIAAIVEIIKSIEDLEKRRQLIIEEILFVAIGVMGLLKE